MEGLTVREKARIRKQKSRARQSRSEGVNRLEVILTDNELAALERGCKSRNPGREPYSRNEYIALLIIKDIAELDAQEKKIPPCKKCGAKPPGHCERAFKGESGCWLSYDCLALNLTVVTGHNENSDGV